MFFVTKLTKRWCYILDTEDWVIERVHRNVAKSVKGIYGATLKCGKNGEMQICSNREMVEEQLVHLRLYSKAEIDVYCGMMLRQYKSQEESIRLPYGLTSIGVYTFKSCRETLKRIVIPDTVIEIGEGAFSRCRRLSEVSLPNAIHTISKNLFYQCGLKHIDLPASVKRIGRCAFFMTALEAIELPCNLQVVGADAFSMCYRLHSVILPESIKIIEDGAFSDCPFLEKIVIPSKGVTFGVNVFGHSANVVIYTVAGSTAVTYAAKHKIPVIYI